MYKKNDLLTNERNISFIVNYLLLATTITGFSAFIFASHSIWSQWNLLVHVLVGGLFSFIALPFFYIHFSRTLGFRRAVVMSTGVVLFGLFCLLVLSGWHLVYFGHSEKLYWIYILHLVSACSFVLMLITHIVVHTLYMPKHRKSAELGTYPSIRRGAAKKSIYINISIQVGIILATWLYPSSLNPEAHQPAVANYEYSYSSHPFRPSLTEVSHGGFVAKDEIADSKKCINCHQDIGHQWMSSIHKEAASDPTYVTNINLLVKNKGIAASRYCEGCHAPIALLTGELSEGGEHGGVVGTVANIEGVSCMSCHGIHSLPSIKGVASYTFMPAVRYLFANSENPLLSRLNTQLIKMSPQQHKKSVGHDILKDPQVCASCHTQFMDKDMNDWGWVRMQDEYGAWADSPYSHQGEENFSNNKYVRCQDCHMPLVKANDPSANANGMVRSHLFLGANTFVPLLRGDTKHFEATKLFLQSNKIRLHIDPPQREDTLQSSQFIEESLRENDEAPYFYYLGERADIQVVISNRGVGHSFPGGTIDINEAWVEFTVTDSNGDMVYQSGYIDDQNDVDTNAYFYRSLPVDRTGKLVWRHDLFNMVGHSFKRVIKSGESDIVKYQFEIPSWAKSPLTVSSKLKYRKLNSRYAKWALKEKYFEIPAIDVAWDSLEIPIKVRKNVR